MELTTIRKFNRITDEINALYHQAAKLLGFADSEMIILYMLCDYGTITQKDIIACTGMSKQTVSSAVNRMTENGWLKRGSEAGHKRDLIPSEKGKKILEEVIRPFMEEEQGIFDSWREEERQEYLRLHEKYRDALRVKVEKMADRKGEKAE